jgi:hypothetical protein
VMTHVRRLSRLVAPLFALACLPVDDRPPPGSLVVTVSGDEALGSGITTTDDWQLVYDRFLLSLGHVRTEDRPNIERIDDCNQYSEATTYYLRIFDMQERSPQTVATLHALGQCELAFQLWRPSERSVLGAGVDESDRAFMRTAGSDPFVDDGGIVLHVAGTATKSGTTLRFAWSFRRLLGYSRCGVIEFQSGKSQTADIRIRSQILFHDRLDESTAELRFDPYAAADANADREVTLEELSAAPVSVGDSFETLADRLYLGFVPQLPRVHDTASCFDGELSDE